MIIKIIDELIQNKILPESIYQWSELTGGTDSIVGVIGTFDLPHMFVVKSNTPKRISAETRFYQIYQEIPLLPKIKYVEPTHRYIIYDYISGATNYNRKKKQELMSELIKQMIQYYIQPESTDDYEWIEDPAAVADDITFSQSVIGSYLNEGDHDLVKEIHIRRSKRLFAIDLYLLHGDFGVHNFLFEGGKLHGIIDPIPSAGRKMYDLLYAFCSSPDDLHFPILLNVVEQLDIGAIDARELTEDMVIALYFRMATCLLHHPEDLTQYQDAWSEWKLLLR